MLTDITVDAERWIDENIILGFRKDYWVERTETGLVFKFRYTEQDGSEVVAAANEIDKAGLPTGMYLADLNFQNVLDDLFETDRGSLDTAFGFQEDGEFWSAYGLCDTPEQILAHYAKSRYITGPTKYCVLLTSFYRKDEPEKWGFRYHKWGEYIGTQNPAHEYLYEDKHIDLIYSFSFVKVDQEKARKKDA